MVRFRIANPLFSSQTLKNSFSPASEPVLASRNHVLQTSWDVSYVEFFAPLRSAKLVRILRCSCNFERCESFWLHLITYVMIFASQVTSRDHEELPRSLTLYIRLWWRWSIRHRRKSEIRMRVKVSANDECQRFWILSSHTFGKMTKRCVFFVVVTTELKNLNLDFANVLFKML